MEEQDVTVKDEVPNAVEQLAALRDRIAGHSPHPPAASDVAELIDILLSTMPKGGSGR